MSTTATRVMEIRDPQGGRNFIRKGDDVRVLAGIGNKRSYIATFCYADLDEVGETETITIHGAKTKGLAPIIRTLRPERVRRVARTKDGERVAHTRRSQKEEAA